MPLPHHQILVCLNERPAESPKGSCKPKGSEDLYKRIRELVHLRGLKRDIAVNSTGCLKCCPFGPTVSVWPEGIYYAQMTPDRVESLLDSIASGKPIDEWKVPAEEIGNY